MFRSYFLKRFEIAFEMDFDIASLFPGPVLLDAYHKIILTLNWDDMRPLCLHLWRCGTSRNLSRRLQ